jgi:hypothetical protein
MYDLVMGAAVVAIGYMLWKQHKAGATTATSGAPITGIPAPIEVQGDASSGYWYDLDNLTAGVMP